MKRWIRFVVGIAVVAWLAICGLWLTDSTAIAFLLGMFAALDAVIAIVRFQRTAPPPKMDRRHLEMYARIVGLEPKARSTVELRRAVIDALRGRPN